MEMEMVAVSSTNIAQIGYDPESSTLRVVFAKSGAVYEYDNVDSDTFEAFKSAESKGEFFASAIKGAYSFSRIA